MFIVDVEFCYAKEKDWFVWVLRDKKLQSVLRLKKIKMT